MAHIRKRGKNSWLLTVELGYDSNGKKIRRTKTIKADKKSDAEKELAKFIIEIESGEYIAPEKMTFNEFLKTWEEKWAVENLSPLTLKTYKHHLENHIKPKIGNLRLDMIKPLHIVDLLKLERKDGKDIPISNETRAYVHRVVKNVFSRAVEWKVIQKNPVEGVKRPKIEKKRVSFYSKEEATVVIEKLYEEPVIWRLLVMAALLGGFRRGELLALEWSDIDFENRTINVSKSISMTKDGQAIVKEPKTESSKRKVTMPEWYMDELKAYWKQWATEKIAVGDKWEGGGHEYVFAGEFGKPLYHTSPTAWWRKFVKKHNLKKVRFHDLRHSAAAILIQSEVSMKAIQERLGHSRHQTTADIYAHVSDSVSRAAADKLEDLAPKKRATIGRQYVFGWRKD